MKKIAILTAFVVLYSAAAYAGVSSSAAQSSVDWTGSAVYGSGGTASSTTPLIGKTSTGVGIAWKSDPNGYAIVTQHKSGTKAFGTAADATSIYQATVTTVGTSFTPSSWTTGASSFSRASTWTTM
jgi:hypothetical protein